MGLGLSRGTVVLQSYDPEWPAAFEQEKALLKSVFGNAAEAIEHVGSTAVPGLSAKPIIDIAVGLRNFQRWSEFTDKLVRLGYTFMEDRVRDVEVFMPKGSETERTHYLHITQYGSTEWQNMLRFRDAMRSNAALHEAYERLKQKLARKHSDDRKAYTAGKEAFIQKIIGASV